MEKIQAEAAAFYSYNETATRIAPRRNILRTTLTSKYDKISLDEISGKKQSNIEPRVNTLDFKIFSLDEIRARKNAPNDNIVQSKTISLNLTRKRTMSEHETITNSSKVIKVVRNNSLVYKKVDKTSDGQKQSRRDPNNSDTDSCRKRTYSEQSDISIHEEELEDCYKFKKIKLTEQTNKPKLNRNRHLVDKESDATDSSELNKTDDSDSEVQIISVDDSRNVSDSIESHVIDLESRDPEILEIVDISEEIDESRLNDIDAEIESLNVPDVVASCVAKNNCKYDSKDRDNILSNIDALLADDSL